MAQSARSRSILVSLCCLGLASYFVFHAIGGRHGLEARAELQNEADRLERELSALEAIRRDLQRDVALLATDKIDPDMLEEQARRILNFAYPDDRLAVSVATDPFSERKP